MKGLRCPCILVRMKEKETKMRNGTGSVKLCFRMETCMRANIRTEKDTDLEYTPFLVKRQGMELRFVGAVQKEVFYGGLICFLAICFLSWIQFWRFRNGRELSDVSVLERFYFCDSG